MRKIKLFFKSMIEIANSQKVVSTVLVVSLIITNLVLIFLYSFINDRRQENIEEDSRIRLYTIKLNKSINDYDIVEKFFKKVQSSKLPQVEVLRISNDTKDIIGNSINTENGIGKATVTALKFEQKPRLYLEQGKYLSKEDELKSQNVIFISNILYNSDSESMGYNHKPTRIDSVDYKIKGVGAMPLDILNVIIMPYSTYIKNNVGYTEANILFSEVLNNKQKELFFGLSEEYFVNSEIILPPKTNKSADDDFYSSLIIVIAIITLALVNAMSLFRFLVSSRTPQYLVYRVCGATKRDISFMLLTEVLLLMTVLFIVSMLLCTFFVSVSAHLEQKLLLNIKGVFICYVIAILVALASVSLTIFRSPNDTGILKNKY